jgi:hypothetical protein
MKKSTAAVHSADTSVNGDSPARPIQIFARRYPGWVAAALSSVVFCVFVTPLLVGNLLLAWAILSAIGIDDGPWFKWGIMLVGTIPAVSISYFVARKAYFHSMWQPFDPSLKKCHVCAYDLTGNLSGVCPECGTQVPARVESAPNGGD